MTHGSLFSGIGGFDLAAEWMGWENKFHCEWNPFGQKILKHYWPNATSYTDITKTDFTIHRGTIDILTGGFPCQPYSQAGKRLGKEDDRHLWPEMLRAIREIQPRWVVGENVRGLTNWNGGLVFDEVQADLEAQGYEVTPFLLPACAVNAPHKRDRIWFIAYTSGNGCKWNKESKEVNNRGVQEGLEKGHESYALSNDGHTSNTNSQGLPKRFQSGIGSIHSQAESHARGESPRAYTKRDWREFPTQPPVCSGNDGVPSQLDGITVPKWRAESIKAGGNAVVPQIVFQIFKSIQKYQSNSL